MKDSWRHQPGSRACCTELTASEMAPALAAAERSRLPARRDLAMAIIAERLSDGKSTLPPGFLARVNQAIY